MFVFQSLMCLFSSLSTVTGAPQVRDHISTVTVTTVTITTVTITTTDEILHYRLANKVLLWLCVCVCVYVCVCVRVCVGPFLKWSCPLRLRRMGTSTMTWKTPTSLPGERERKRQREREREKKKERERKREMDVKSYSPGCVVKPLQRSGVPG